MALGQSRLVGGHRAIIWFTVALHAISGIGVILAGGVLDTAWLSPFNLWFPESSWIIGTTLIAIAACAALAMRVYPNGGAPGGHSALSATLLLPQSLSVLGSGLLAIGLAVNGVYADGVQRPTLFILIDQLPIILLMVFHTAAVLDPPRHAG